MNSLQLFKGVSIGTPFGQMLTEMETAMDVRTNMQSTANDERALGMMNGMQNLSPGQRTLENAVGLTEAIAGAQFQSNKDDQGKLIDVMMSLMADFLRNTTEDGWGVTDSPCRRRMPAGSERHRKQVLRFQRRNV